MGKSDSTRRVLWQQWISTNICNTGHLTSAGVYAHSGREWGTCSGLQLRPDEVVRLVTAFHEPEKLNDESGEGLQFANGAFRAIRVGHNFVYLKDRQMGLMARNCRTCVVVAIFGTPNFASIVYDILERIANYLEDKGL